MENKNFIGRVKEIPTKYGKITKLSFSPEDLKKVSEGGWLNVILKTAKNGGFYMVLDEYKPAPKPIDEAPF
jgi:hypothetical protein